MASFTDVLEELRETSTSNKELGERFEELMLQFFRKDKRFSHFTDIQRLKGKDKGIDLIACDESRRRHAIQCKCYADDYVLKYDDVTHLVTQASEKRIKNKIIVYTCRSISSDAAESCQRLGILRITRADLENAKIYWDANSEVRPASNNMQRPHKQSVLGGAGTQYGRVKQNFGFNVGFDTIVGWFKAIVVGAVGIYATYLVVQILLD